MSTNVLSTSSRRVGLLGVGALTGVLVAAIAGPALSVSAADTASGNPHIISVDGTGRVKIHPDVADLSVGVLVQRDRAGDASADAASEMSKVIEALKAQGIAEDDIQTTTLSLDPVYDYNRDPAALTGYSATNIVSVTIRDLTKVGTTIDAAVEAGANNVGGLTFRLDDTSKAETQARNAAMAQAKAKADELAAAAGVRVTGVISITESSSSVPMPIYYGQAAAGAMRDAASTPVQAGNVEIDVTVSVVYSME